MPINAAEHDDLALLDDGVVLHDGCPVSADRGWKVAQPGPLEGDEVQSPHVAQRLLPAVFVLAHTSKNEDKLTPLNNTVESSRRGESVTPIRCSGDGIPRVLGEGEGWHVLHPEHISDVDSAQQKQFVLPDGELVATSRQRLSCLAGGAVEAGPRGELVLLTEVQLVNLHAVAVSEGVVAAAHHEQFVLVRDHRLSADEIPGPVGGLVGRVNVDPAEGLGRQVAAEHVIAGQLAELHIAAKDEDVAGLGGMHDGGVLIQPHRQKEAIAPPKIRILIKNAFI